jgi:hypothetical protein
MSKYGINEIKPQITQIAQMGNFVNNMALRQAQCEKNAMLR